MRISGRSKLVGAGLLGVVGLMMFSGVYVGRLRQFGRQDSAQDWWDTLRLSVVFIDSPMIESFVNLAGFYANAIYYLNSRDSERPYLECTAIGYNYPIFFIELEQEGGRCIVSIQVKGFESGYIRYIGDRVVKYLFSPGYVVRYAVLPFGGLGLILLKEGLDTVRCFRAIGLYVPEDSKGSNLHVMVPVRYEIEDTSMLLVEDGLHTCFIAEIEVDTLVQEAKLVYFEALPLYILKD